MSLRSPAPYWPAKNGLLSSYPSLTDDERCDVAIIGGGITGALVAHEMTAAGVDCVLLEKDAIGEGSTAASTALLQYEPDTELRELTARAGAQHARRVYQLGLEAIDAIEALTVDLRDSCGFMRRESWYLARHWWNLVSLKRECGARERAGFRVDYLNGREIAGRSSLQSAGAIVSHGNAEIDPFRFTHRLVGRAEIRGLRAYERTEMTRFDDHGDHVVLHTSGSARVHARRIVFATGYESEQYLGREMGTLRSTYAFASHPVTAFVGWPERALLWESARPYFYLRTTPDMRVIIGGGDTGTKNSKRRDARLPSKTELLRAQALLMFPELSLDVAYAWAATFGESADGLPYIGPCSRCPNAYFALGYGGNGITFAMIAARLITAIHCGVPDRDANIFAFDR